MNFSIRPGQYIGIMRYSPYLVIIVMIFLSACTSSLPAFKTPDVPEQYYRISFFAYAPGTLIEHGKTS
ncbi:MAG: hypothetical protein LBQ88_18210, partial [Treponema sp.]|nr:hypothetical protein [Treponema sp.]